MRNILIIISIVFAVKSYSQQIPLQTQFSDNLYSINPAVAGNLPYNPLLLTYKQLWSGFDNAPRLYSLSTHTSLSEKVGIGAKVYSFVSGPTNRTGVEGSYSYNINLGANENSPKLAFGLSAFMYQYKLDKSNLTFEDPNDNTILYSSDKLIIPDAAFGTFLYNKDYHVGLSVYQLFNRKVNLLNKDYLELRQVRHYNFHAGYEYAINDDYQINGSFLIKYIESGILQVDFTLKTIVKQFAWAGISYRSKDAASVLLGVSKDRFAFGYAYDIALTDISKYSRGSHEVVLIYTLPAGDSKRSTFLKSSEN